MKKLFSYVLALTLLVSTMSVAFAAPADVTDKSEQQAVDVLMALGVVDGYEDGTYKPARVVTRAEMAKLVVTALGFDALAAGSTNDFTDVAKNHWAAGDIGVCVGLGIVEGYGDGTFGPENPVKYSEAATMLVRALGWTDDAIGGTWPTNYVSKAMALKIFKGVDYKNEGAVRGDVAELIYNTLNLKIGTINQNGNYEESSDDTMIKRLGGNKEAKAVFMGTEDTLGNLRAHVGEYTQTYTNDSGKVILAMNAATTLVGTWDASEKKLKVGDTTYTAKEAADDDKFVQFENGVSVKDDATFTDINTDGTYMFSAKVAGKNITKIYATSQWEVKEAKVADDNTLKQLADDSKLLDKEFNMTDEDKINCNSFELVGADKLTDIKKGDVVYVYTAGTPEKVTKVAVGTTVIENAKITKRVGKKLTIEGKVYEGANVTGAVSNIDTNNDYNPKNKNSFDFRLDVYGKIYAIETVGTVKADTYAVMLAVKNGSTDPFSGDADAKVKLFLADGTSKDFDVKVKAADTDLMSADGVWAYDMDDSDATLPNPGGILVKYGTNADGAITAINPAGAQSAIANKEIVGNYVKDTGVLTSKTVVFTYSGSNKNKASNYGTMTLASLKVAAKMSGDVALEAGNIIATTVTSSTSSKVYALISSGVAQVPEGNQVKAFVDGVEKEYVTDSTTSLFAIKKLTMSGDKATFADPVVSETTTALIGNTLRANDTNGRVVTKVELEGNTIKITRTLASQDPKTVYSYVTLSSDAKVYTHKGDEVKLVTADKLVEYLTHDIDNDPDKIKAGDASIKAFSPKASATVYDIILVELQ